MPLFRGASLLRTLYNYTGAAAPLASSGGIGVQLRLVPCGRVGPLGPRRERLSFFVHFRRIPTAYQRCVQVAAPQPPAGGYMDSKRRQGHFYEQFIPASSRPRRLFFW